MFHGRAFSSFALWYAYYSLTASLCTENGDKDRRI